MDFEGSMESALFYRTISSTTDVTMDQSYISFLHEEKESTNHRPPSYLWKKI